MALSGTTIHAIFGYMNGTMEIIPVDFSSHTAGSPVYVNPLAQPVIPRVPVVSQPTSQKAKILSVTSSKQPQKPSMAPSEYHLGNLFNLSQAEGCGDLQFVTASGDSVLIHKFILRSIFICFALPFKSFLVVYVR